MRGCHTFFSRIGRDHLKALAPTLEPFGHLRSLFLIMPSPASTWLENLPLIALDTYRDTIEGSRLLCRAFVGFLKLLFLGFVFASAQILSLPAYIVIGIYDLYRWARRSAATPQHLLPTYRHETVQETPDKKGL